MGESLGAPPATPTPRSPWKMIGCDEKQRPPVKTTTREREHESDAAATGASNYFAPISRTDGSSLKSNSQSENISLHSDKNVPARWVSGYQGTAGNRTRSVLQVI